MLRQHLYAHGAQAVSLGVPLTGDTLVFTYGHGSPILPLSLSHAFRRIARRAGLEGLRLHDMRHTHASLMLKEGVHPKVMQERLGHSRVSTTLDTYSHVAPGLQEAAALKFEEGLQRDAEARRTLAEGVDAESDVSKMLAKAPQRTSSIT